jgi:hypothetical protein
VMLVDKIRIANPQVKLHYRFNDSQFSFELIVI